MQDTAWERYGTGINPKCADCMVHCGYEPTAVNDTFKRPLVALKTFLRGPRTSGPMAPELPFQYDDDAVSRPRLVAQGDTAPPASGTSKKRVA